jgi:hypothetical protein
MTDALTVRRAADGIYLACNGDDIVATAYEEDVGWWRAFLPNGTSRLLHEPYGGSAEAETCAAESVLRRRLAR